ncbi:MAG: right-handed parallel beta-helix repeat-containing protein [Sphingobacteriales bacterium]|nr:MAG: right-handed parallel beta-helix repeat-containing protein [Sphingobacteriales bacterium]TAF81394.1 MAG: right-handed parallel beta-helix repeat-containing protein [Sphingobacteriales bacterium]
MKFIAFLIFTCCGALQLYATTFYLAANGNDGNKGTAKSQPWKTIKRLNQQILKPGDKVLFKKGDVFFGEITVKQSGSSKQPILFSAYGKGINPVITGAISLKNFKPYSSTIWKTNLGDTVTNLFDNGNLKTLARYPNTGFAVMQGGVGDSVTFIDSSLKQKNNYWKNANLRYRTWDWEVRTSIVKNFESYKVTLTDSSTNTLGKGWGYYFDNKFEELDTLGEWYYHPTQKIVYYYGGENFNGKNIDAVTLKCGISISKYVSYINIYQLNIQKFDTYGISLMGNNRYINFANNIVQYINHTAIFINEIAKNCNIYANEIKAINGRGIYALEPEKLAIQNNYVHHIGLKMGYGISGVNGMVGITIANNEVIKLADSHTALHNSIKNNIVENTGYVGIRMDGAYSTMQNNIVRKALLVLSDGAALYCWAKSKFYTHNNIIKNNIVSDVKGSNYGTTNSHKLPDANGIYLDNLVYNILVEGNTVSNISAIGIHINSDAYNNTVKNNILYNCKNSLSVAEWAKPNSTKNNLFSYNTVFLNKKNYRGVLLINWLLPSTQNMANFDNNKYYSLQSDSLARDLYNTTDTAGKKITIDKSYSLLDWTKMYGYEKNGSFFNLKTLNLNKYVYPHLIINNTKFNKNIRYKNKTAYNLNSKIINKIKLLPFTSAIIMLEK